MQILLWAFRHRDSNPGRSVRAEYPNQPDYSGDVPFVVFDKCRHLPSLPLSIEYMPLMLIAFVHGSAAVLLVPDLNWKQL